MTSIPPMNTRALFDRRDCCRAVSSAIDDRDHIGGILGDDCKELILFRQFAADSLELKLLVNRIDVEQEYKARQSTDPLLQVKPLGNS